MEAQERQSEPREQAFPGSVNVFSALGVPIRLHFTFLLLAIFLIVLGLSGTQSAPMNAIYIAALFLSVLLHELGHAAVAKRYGIRTLEIVMFPIGGLARLNRNPKAREELWIAVAGPLVNMLIAGVIFISLFRWGTILPWEQIVAASDGNLLQRIAVGNLILALFNLLPAYPMDGGRVLRSLLARFQSEDEATRMAARAGQVLAMLMGLIGLLYMQFFLVFIALFVYLGASQEAAAVVGRSLTQGVPVRAAMVTDFRTLSHGDTIGNAANMLLSTSQQDFPVLHGGSVIGLLGRNSLVRSMAMEGPEAYVASAMNRNFTVLAPDMDLAEALPKMGQAGSCALVMDGAQLVGLLTAENISEFLVLRRIGMKPELRTV